MCGIAGALYKNKTSFQVEDQARLADPLRHRGPDGFGSWVSEDKSILFLHRRLSILDLSDAGVQPMHCLNGRFVIIFNGEIYNFLEIRTELQSKGYHFFSETDSEVIPAAYAEWGIDMLNRFNGMWAFAMYDRQEDFVVLCRDRYGIKPLYYYEDGDRLFFASEVKAIQHALGDAAVPDADVLRSIASGMTTYHGSSRTYLKDVHSVPSGSYLKVSQGKSTLRTWYTLTEREVPARFENQANHLKELLIDSCRLRLRSDVPVATCLSGGIDSGAITALIHRLNPSDSQGRFRHYTHESFHASFPGTFLDERTEAESLAAEVGNKLHVLEILPPSASDLNQAFESADGPMHSLAFYPIWRLYQFIRQHGIKVTIDGQGPDEMLGGYRPLKPALQGAWQNKNLRWMKDVYHVYSTQGEFSQFSSKKFARQVLKGMAREQLRRLLGRQAPYSDPFAAEYERLLNHYRHHFPNEFDLHLHQEFFYNPLPAILNQYDRCSMASGVECRMPFMDFRIVEFIFSLPGTSKVGNGYTKRILREAMKGVVPDSTRLNKKKIGFNAPMAEWMKGPLKEFMSDIIFDDGFDRNPYFDGNHIRKKFTEFIQSDTPTFGDAYFLYPAVHVAWWLKKNRFS